MEGVLEVWKREDERALVARGGGMEAICQESRRDGGKGEAEVSRIVVV